VLIADVVPFNVVDVSYTNSGTTITPIGGINYDWQAADLPPGKGGIITIVGALDVGLPYGMVFTNTASIVSARRRSRQQQ
jgi:hypothetical protein